MEKELNKSALPVEERVDNAIYLMPVSAFNDLEGSAGYRKFILRNLLISIVNKLEG
jgi:hypothetical protein